MRRREERLFGVVVGFGARLSLGRGVERGEDGGCVAAAGEVEGEGEFASVGLGKLVGGGALEGDVGCVEEEGAGVGGEAGPGE